MLAVIAASSKPRITPLIKHGQELYSYNTLPNLTDVVYLHLRCEAM
jgi:hypothetical protein